MRFTRSTPCGEFLDAIAERNACAPGAEWAEQFRGKTFGELADAFPGSSTSEQAWVHFVLRFFAKEMTSELRKKFIAKVTDPMGAFQLYLKCEGLSKSDDAALEKVFKGKLPTAEKELADGVVKRRGNN